MHAIALCLQLYLPNFTAAHNFWQTLCVVGKRCTAHRSDAERNRTVCRDEISSLLPPMIAKKSTKAMLMPSELKVCGELILLRYIGLRFLWKMVRQIVRTTVDILRARPTTMPVSHLGTDTTTHADFESRPSARA